MSILTLFSAPQKFSAMNPLLLFALLASTAVQAADTKISYDKPAANLAREALPGGNGSLYHGVEPTPPSTTGLAGITPEEPGINVKVDALLAKMTLEEKVYQLSAAHFGKGTEILVDGGTTSNKAVAEQLGDHGVGFVSCLATSLGARQSTEMFNALQCYSLEKTRLGIPLLFNESGLHGLTMCGACSYPQPIALAATFDPELVEQIATAIGREAHSRGVGQVLDPVLDLAREPRHGRMEETYGEDPFLASRMGVAYVRGVQSQGVICGAKHFVANFVGDAGREGANVGLSRRALFETHLVPYEAAVRQADLLSIMNAYNDIDGVPCASNRWLLTDLLRGQWGFQGIVVSDWCAVDHVFDAHHAAASEAEAARLCLEAGLDIDLPQINCYKRLITEVKDGRLPESVVDQSVRRVLRLKYRLGLFEHPYRDPQKAEQLADAPEHRQLALRAARQSIVLLKNDHGVLPLAPGAKKIAVIGPNADMLRLGIYSAVGVKGVTVLAGLKARLGDHAELTYAKGCGLTEETTDGFAEAVNAANSADVCILVMGGGPGTGGECHERATLELMGQQEALIQRIADTGKPVVVVLLDGRPVVMNRWIDRVAAVLMAWFPGEEGGTAVAEVLTGACNPSGHLPVTFPRYTGQCPMTYDQRPFGREGTYAEISAKPVTERYQPRFPFGFGLSYTTFAFSNLKCLTGGSGDRARATITVDVSNTGSVAGDEVVQLYLSHPVCRITQPVRRLRAFSRIMLNPGETRTVTFTLDAGDLSILNESLQPEVGPGPFRVQVGGDCLSGLTETFSLGK